MPIIKTIEGNLVTRAQYGHYTEIAHGCNCFCVMGAGIAPQIAKAFPDAEKVDFNTLRGDTAKLGKLTVGLEPVFDLPMGNTLKILNLYTQYSTGLKENGDPAIDYEALEGAFRLFNWLVKTRKDSNEEYAEHQLSGIPMIGAGLAGGDWKRIARIINDVTPDISIELVVYVP